MTQDKHKRTGAVSRRGFLKTAAVGALAPAIVPASALGKDGTTAPSNRLTFGLIGCGGQGTGVMGGAMQLGSTQVLAVCDVNEVNAKKAKATVDDFHENKDCKIYKDFREINGRDDIDAMIIATPDHWHALAAVSAARNGKHIYCEKPLTWSLGEGRVVADTVKETGVTFQVGSMQRSHPVMKRACELVLNGHLGKVKHINVGLPNGGHAKWVTHWPDPPETLDYDFYVGPAEWVAYHPERLDWNWRWWMGFGGSQMNDWIGHHGDIAHMGMGWSETGPVEIRPRIWALPNAKNNLYNSPERYRIDFTYADGTTMTVGSSSEMPSTFKQCGGGGTQWIGENGKWLWVDRYEMKSNPEDFWKMPPEKDDFRFRREANHMRDFVNCIKTGEETIAPAEHGHRSASIGHLAKIASMLEHDLKWDPERESFVDNPAVDALLMRKYRGDWSLDKV